MLDRIFGWHKNSGMIAVFGIEIIMMQLNSYLLFRNSENNCYFVIPREKKNYHSSQFSLLF
jgi:hypothetical protein